MAKTNMHSCRFRSSDFRRKNAALNSGPEPADCILLYAAKRPGFIVDAYPRRFPQKFSSSTNTTPSSSAGKK